MAKGASPVVAGLEGYERKAAETQPQYETLPVLVGFYGSSGKITTARWELTEREREMIADGADVYVQIIQAKTDFLAPSRVLILRKDCDSSLAEKGLLLNDEEALGELIDSEERR